MGTTVDELQRALGLSTLLPILRARRDRGLVERTDCGYAVASSPPRESSRARA